jgi:hypothetical protein
MQYPLSFESPISALSIDIYYHPSFNQNLNISALKINLPKKTFLILDDF